MDERGTLPRDGDPNPEHDHDRSRAHRALRLPVPATTEGWLVIVIIVIGAALGLATDTFLTLANLFDLLNISAINLIFAAGAPGRARGRRDRHLVRGRRFRRAVPHRARGHVARRGEAGYRALRSRWLSASSSAP